MFYLDVWVILGLLIFKSRILYIFLIIYKFIYIFY